uniref:Transposase-associated domain-containing protein n=1 Tax=Noccaea caerulescens TaxID=107243 RepID=A0A1J3CP28_NOCCA
MDKSWITKHRLSQDYINGVNGFLDFAFLHMKTDMIKCPCQRCCLIRFKGRVEVEGDLFCHGFLPTYTNGYMHGEEIESDEDTVGLERESPIDYTQDPTMNLLEDVFPSLNNSSEAASPIEDHPKQKETLDDLLSDCNQALYEGCQTFSKLSFMLKLYHIKCMSRISDKGMSMIIDLLKEAFEHAKLPDSFNSMKKIIQSDASWRNNHRIQL